MDPKQRLWRGICSAAEDRVVIAEAPPLATAGSRPAIEVMRRGLAAVYDPQLPPEHYELYNVEHYSELEHWGRASADRPIRRVLITGVGERTLYAREPLILCREDLTRMLLDELAEIAREEAAAGRGA